MRTRTLYLKNRNRRHTTTPPGNMHRLGTPLEQDVGGLRRHCKTAATYPGTVPMRCCKEVLMLRVGKAWTLTLDKVWRSMTSRTAHLSITMCCKAMFRRCVLLSQPVAYGFCQPLVLQHALTVKMRLEANLATVCTFGNETPEARNFHPPSPSHVWWWVQILPGLRFSFSFHGR